MRNEKSTFYLNLTFIFLIIVFFFFLDKPVAVWMNTNLKGSWLYNFSSLIGKFSSPEKINWIMIFLAIIACFFLIRDYKEAAKPYAFVAVCIFVAFFVAVVLKVVLARYRPEMYFSDHLFGFSFFSTNDKCNSFPSGHTIASFTIALSLFCIFKEKSLCWALLILAVIIGLSRIIITAHYCSDVIASVYVAVLVTQYVDSIYLRRLN